MPEYLGPSHVFYLEEGGKPYKRGENVPLSPEQARHMGLVKNGGHRFKGVAPDQRPSRAEHERALAERSADAKA
jgi:hypothetical protein